MKKWSLSLIVLAVVALIGCDKSKPNLELIQDMMDQPALKAQDTHPNAPEQSSMRVPPEGTVPRGWQPYNITDPEEAGRVLKSPYVGSITPEVLENGRVYYTRYCQVCHGEKADGKGPVHEKFQGLIKSLQTQKIRDWSDGRIYHVITAGQGVMGSYLSQINKPENRWAIVAYVRHLQKQNPVDGAGSAGNQ